jgi:hypothetical protein
MQHHAGELKGLILAQAQGARLLQPDGVHRTRTAQHQIGAEQRCRLVDHRTLQTIGEETDGRGGGHRDHQRQDQDAQLAGAPVAQQQPHGEGEALKRHR